MWWLLLGWYLLSHKQATTSGMGLSATVTPTGGGAHQIKNPHTVPNRPYGGKGKAQLFQNAQHGYVFDVTQAQSYNPSSISQALQQQQQQGIMPGGMYPPSGYGYGNFGYGPPGYGFPGGWGGYGGDPGYGYGYGGYDQSYYGGSAVDPGFGGGGYSPFDYEAYADQGEDPWTEYMEWMQTQ